MSSKTLIAFDFDKTIINENSDMVVFNMIKSKEERSKVWNNYKEGKWTEFMNTVFQYLHRNGQSLHNIESVLHQSKLTNGMKELFCHIQNNPDLYDCIIISDSNTWFIKTIVKEKKIESVFKEVFTNGAEFDSEHKLVIHPCHSHSHSSCPENMCKGSLLTAYIQKAKSANQHYKSVCYIGDGGNDFCPCTTLQLRDFVFPRKGFALEKKLNQVGSSNSHIVKANIVPWSTGLDILNQLTALNTEQKKM